MGLYHQDLTLVVGVGVGVSVGVVKPIDLPIHLSLVRYANIWLCTALFLNVKPLVRIYKEYKLALDVLVFKPAYC